MMRSLHCTQMHSAFACSKHQGRGSINNMPIYSRPKNFVEAFQQELQKEARRKVQVFSLGSHSVLQGREPSQRGVGESAGAQPGIWSLKVLG